MKKIILLSSALCVLASYSANAEVSVTFDNPDVSVTFGGSDAPTEPVYVAPPVYAPGYVEYYHRYPSQYYDRRGHHRHDDWAYWANERRDRDERDQGGHDHHDNENHGNGDRNHRGHEGHDKGNHGKGNRDDR